MLAAVKTVSTLAALASTGFALMGAGPGPSVGGTGWSGNQGEKNIPSNGINQNQDFDAKGGDDSKFRIDFRFGDRDWGRRDRDRHEDRDYHAPVCVETLPCNLEFRAYQVDDNLMIVATGENRTGGFTTELERCDGGWGKMPTITLRNFGPSRGRFGTQCVTPFEVSGAVNVRGCVEEIKILVAGEVRCVKVSHVGTIRRG